MLKILVVDDAQVTLDKFKEIGTTCAQMCTLELCGSVGATRQLLDENDFHIICLDINMEGTDGGVDSGLVLAQEIRDGAFDSVGSDTLLLCISGNCDVGNKSIQRLYLQYFDLVPGKLNGCKVLHDLIVKFKDHPGKIAAYRASLKGLLQAKS